VSNIEVSVICITARSVCGIEELIASLQKQTLPRDRFELIYCDRLYAERKTAMLGLLNKSSLRFQYLQDTPPKPGPCPSTARNQCIAKARGTYIVSIDDLTTMPPGLLEGHLSYFHKGYDAIAGSFISEGDVREELDQRPDIRLELWPGHDMLYTGDSWIAHNYFGMHVSYTKEMAFKLNGYDSWFDGVYGQEDMDFGIRLRRAGCTMAWAPELAVHLNRGAPHDSTHVSLLEKKKLPVPEALIQGVVQWRNDRLVALLTENIRRIRANPHFDLSAGEWE